MNVNEWDMSKVVGKDIFTDKGAYCGRVLDLELDLSKYRMRSLVVEAVKGSYLSQIVGGKPGVIVPYSMVKAIGDIIIIKHISAVSED